MSHLKQESSALEELSRQLFLETVDLQEAMDRIEYSKTFKGKYFNFLGHFFSGYCVYKIFMVSTWNSYILELYYFTINTKVLVV